MPSITSEIQNLAKRKGSLDIQVRRFSQIYQKLFLRKAKEIKDFSIRLKINGKETIYRQDLAYL